MTPNHGAAANDLSAARSSVAGFRERTVRSTAATEAIADRLAVSSAMKIIAFAILLAVTGCSHGEKLLLSPKAIVSRLL